MPRYTSNRPTVPGTEGTEILGHQAALLALATAGFMEELLILRVMSTLVRQIMSA
jgi:hypothetical protein